MKALQMADFRTPKPTRYLIRGGWILRIPDFGADPEYEDILTGFLMPKYRYDAYKARVEAKKRIDGLGRYAFMHGLKEFLVRTAIDYGRRFPQKINADRSLDGFDPAEVAKLYVPFADKPGRNGRVDVRNLLVRMSK